MVYATCCIMVLSFPVWLHHFFTMGSGANVNAFFGITTMIISIPTGVKIFNWLFTMYRGRVRMTTPVMWTLGFMVTFVIGGMTGVLMAVPAADFVLHNSLFLIAHFHNVIIGGVLFGYRRRDLLVPEGLGFAGRAPRQVRLLVLAGGLLLRLHAAVRTGPDGHDPPPEPHRQPGMDPVPARGRDRRGADRPGIVFRVLQIIVSIRNRKALADVTGDPWNGRTLEWATRRRPRSITSRTPRWCRTSTPSPT